MSDECVSKEVCKEITARHDVQIEKCEDRICKIEETVDKLVQLQAKQAAFQEQYMNMLLPMLQWLQSEVTKAREAEEKEQAEAHQVESDEKKAAREMRKARQKTILDILWKLTVTISALIVGYTQVRG